MILLVYTHKHGIDTIFIQNPKKEHEKLLKDLNGHRKGDLTASSDLWEDLFLYEEELYDNYQVLDEDCPMINVSDLKGTLEIITIDSDL